MGKVRILSGKRTMINPTAPLQNFLSNKSAIDASLQRLQMEYVDIVYINRTDPMCPIEGRRTALGIGMLRVEVKAKSMPDNLGTLPNTVNQLDRRYKNICSRLVK
ncbi:hypothetical protein TNCV_1638011 [Trichonephila clavipes]|nr:hypothetical protein TNCV_1638011 [Trichonephila clavipes]